MHTRRETLRCCAGKLGKARGFLRRDRKTRCGNDHPNILPGASDDIYNQPFAARQLPRSGRAIGSRAVTQSSAKPGGAVGAEGRGRLRVGEGSDRGMGLLATHEEKPGRRAETGGVPAAGSAAKAAV